jgi:hypothetical protein
MQDQITSFGLQSQGVFQLALIPGRTGYLTMLHKAGRGKLLLITLLLKARYHLVTVQIIIHEVRRKSDAGKLRHEQNITLSPELTDYLQSLTRDRHFQRLFTEVLNDYARCLIYNLSDREEVTSVFVEVKNVECFQKKFPAKVRKPRPEHADRSHIF